MLSSAAAYLGLLLTSMFLSRLIASLVMSARRAGSGYSLNASLMRASFLMSLSFWKSKARNRRGRSVVGWFSFAMFIISPASHSDVLAARDRQTTSRKVGSFGVVGLRVKY